MALDQGASEGQLRSIICAWKSIEKKKKKRSPKEGNHALRKASFSEESFCSPLLLLELDRE
jgi:hypothetical protein